MWWPIAVKPASGRLIRDHHKFEASVSNTAKTVASKPTHQTKQNKVFINQLTSCHQFDLQGGNGPFQSKSLHKLFFLMLRQSTWQKQHRIYSDALFKGTVYPSEEVMRQLVTVHQDAEADEGCAQLTLPSVHLKTPIRGMVPCIFWVCFPISISLV